jgi:hypothetical protein
MREGGGIFVEFADVRDRAIRRRMTLDIMRSRE